MKKLLLLVFVLCLAAIPAMAEECAHVVTEWELVNAPAACMGYDGQKVGTCEKCGEDVWENVPFEGTIIGAHSYDEKGMVVMEPTCTETGIELCMCTLCGRDAIEKEIPATGHKVTEWIVTDEPSACFGDGIKYGNCDICHVEVWEEIPFDGTYTGEHVFKNWEVLKPATCTEPGKEISMCFVCGREDKEREIPALGHNVTEWEIVSEPAACMGYEGQKVGACETCDEEIWEEIPFEGTIIGAHSYDEKGMVVMEPTCTETGIELCMCTLCGRDAIEKEIPALGHDETDVEVTKEATCTEDGEKVLSCSRCGAEGEMVVIPALGHQESEEMEVTKEATCTEDGEKIGKCTRCGAEGEKAVIPALGHNVTEWEIVSEPAACMGYEGQKVGTCETCDEEIWEEIPFEGEIIGEHRYDEHGMVEKEATCTEPGLEICMCTLCGRDAIEKEIPALGHDETDVEVTKEATCTEDGEKIGKCARCGAEGEKAVIPALGHDHVWTTTTEATCTEDGEKVGKCSRCDDTLTEVIAAIGHTEVIDPAVSSNCVRDGLTEGKHCSGCGLVFVAQEKIEKSGHSWRLTEVNDAKCGVEGSRVHKCGNCGSLSIHKLAALSHTYGEDGVCSLCGKKEIVATFEYVNITEDGAEVILTVEDETENIETEEFIALKEATNAVLLYHITMTVNGEEYVLDEQVKIKISCDEELAEKLANTKLMVQLEDGTLVEIEYTIVDGMIEFETVHLGVFVFVPAEAAE